MSGVARPTAPPPGRITSVEHFSKGFEGVAAYHLYARMRARALHPIWENPFGPLRAGSCVRVGTTFWG